MNNYTGNKRKMPVWRKIFIGLGVAGIVTLAVLFVLMVSAAGNAPPEDVDAVVLVLGARVADETPGVILQARIEAAYDYLSRNPALFAIASGGYGAGAAVSEARAIRDALVQKGIDGGRILLEDRATNTRENIRFSAALIAEHGLPDTVVIVSDNFHQFRAGLFARRAGLTPYAAGCATAWPHWLWYWPREIAAIAAAMAIDN